MRTVNPTGARMGAAAALLVLVWLQIAPAIAPAVAQGLSARNLPASLGQAGRGWMAVGRLEVAATESHPQSFCTTSLIAEDRALTAAHCVIDRRTGRSLPPAAMQVRLGFQNGRAEASRRVTGVLLPAGVGAAVQADAGGHGVIDGDAALRLVPLDLAVLLLDSPVRLPQIAPLPPAEGQPMDGRLLSVVSYARGRSEMAALQDNCRLIAPRADGSLVLMCEVDNGASGAPVLLIEPDGPRIVAVVSARAEMMAPSGERMQVALAVPMGGAVARDLLRVAANPGAAAGVEQSPEGVRIRRPAAHGGPTAGSGGGARFVRP